MISPLLGSGCTVGGTAKRIDYKETFLYFDDGDDDDDGALQRELITKRLFFILMIYIL